MKTTASALREEIAHDIFLRSGPGGLTAATLVALALFLLPLAARADSRNDAKRHYRDGMSLIAAGQLERGIEELKSAYAIRPHPDVLYNIARAYVDLGNIPEALRYFRLYAATDPEDKAQVESVMTRLSAAIGTGAPGAPGGPARGTQPASTAAAQPASTDVQKLLAQLQDLIAKGKAATEPAAPAAPNAAPALPADDEMFEAVPVTAQTRATAKQIAAELAGPKDSDDLFEEQVVTAGVRSSSEAKAPASLTVINDEEIRMSGAATVPELLRRVPGLEVAEMNPSDVNVSIRGFNRRVANKVLVLVDGRSVYQDFLGNTIWGLVDVSISDIARVEVIRGPGSALFGASAFAGVINIITKTGDEANGAHLYFAGGTHNTVQGTLSAGGRSGQLGYRVSLGYDRADKWTRDAAGDRVDLTSQFAQPNRSREFQRGNVGLTYDVGRLQLSLGGGYDDVNTEIFPLGALRSFFNQGNAGYLRAEIGSGPSRVKAFWNSLRMKTGPEYWPDGIGTISTSIRSDIVDVTGQTGTDFRLGGTHHFSIGAGYRFKSVDWGYLGLRPDGSRRYEEHHFNAFLQEDWQITRKLQLVLSYRVDRDPLFARYDVTSAGLMHSPRGTLVFEFKPDQVLRLSAGTAFREPTFTESYIDLLAPVPNQPAVAVHFMGDRTLRPEQILQGELGYRGKWGERFAPEIVVYAERVTNLITDGVFRKPTADTGRDPATGQYVVGFTGFNNDPGQFLGLGAEVGGKLTPFDGFELSANYAYERIADCQSACTTDTSKGNETSAVLANTPQHKVNVMASYRSRAGLDLAADAHFVSAVTWYEKSFNSSSAAGIDFIGYPLDAYTLVNGRVGYRLLHDKLDLGVAVYNLLGIEHREHPFGNVIGRRVLFTASGAF
jgi:iron complex outermembrane receptor protein